MGTSVSPISDGQDLDFGRLLDMFGQVMDRMTADTVIGRILMPGPTYLGIWARDTGVAALGLHRLGRCDLSAELLRRYWSYQITEESDPQTFVFRNKCFASWTDADSFGPSPRQLLAEVGAFPTSVYIETPDFPAGTREIYGARADLDGACWLIIALHDYYSHSGDVELLRELAPRVLRAVRYLNSRDMDGDHLLEQGPNEDWADTLLRRGNVSYTQAVWFRCLQAAGHIASAVGDDRHAAVYFQKSEAVRGAIDATLMSEHGYYVNALDRDTVSLRRSLDTALLVAFGVADEVRGRGVLDMLATLDGPFGPAVIEPGYIPAETGPSKYPPGQYQNEGMWPWIASYAALAWAKIGERERARSVIASALEIRPRTVHEWVDTLNGERHHADFATGAGALAWARRGDGILQDCAIGRSAGHMQQALEGRRDVDQPSRIAGGHPVPDPRSRDHQRDVLLVPLRPKMARDPMVSMSRPVPGRNMRSVHGDDVGAFRRGGGVRERDIGPPKRRRYLARHGRCR